MLQRKWDNKTVLKVSYFFWLRKKKSISLYIKALCVNQKLHWGYIFKIPAGAGIGTNSRVPVSNNGTKSAEK